MLGENVFTPRAVIRIVLPGTALFPGTTFQSIRDVFIPYLKGDPYFKTTLIKCLTHPMCKHNGETEPVPVPCVVHMTGAHV